MTFGFHASHEQFAPSALLRTVQLASASGFAHAMCSDHFSPWTAQGEVHSGFAWSWLGAALATTRATFGLVSAPGQRYHPAIAAQAFATLAEMFEGRFWVALGSGEFLNEHIVDPTWPDKSERQARLEECVQVMRALFAGETVNHRGRILVDRAKLYTRPSKPPPLLAAAASPATAARVAAWADGLITVNMPRPKLREILDAFRGAGGAGKPAYLQVHMSLADSEQDALAAAHRQWRHGALQGPLAWDVATPEDLDVAAALVRPDDLRESVRISTHIDQQIDWLKQDLAMGFDRVYLHQVGEDQDRLAQAGPRLRETLGQAGGATGGER